jgi:DNA-binding CsgD family transcriptional regulator
MILYPNLNVSRIAQRRGISSGKIINAKKPVMKKMDLIITNINI